MADDEELCEIDGRPITMMAFKGTGVCCQNCKIKRDGDVHKPYGTGATSAS